MADFNIAVVSNTISGKGKAITLSKEICQYLSLLKIEHTSYVDDWPDSLDHHTCVWVVGGDGTLHYLVNRYPNLKVAISIFRGGTGNDFYNFFYKKKYDTIDQITYLLTNRNTKSIDALVCNNKIAINTIGIGLDGETLKSMNLIRFIGDHFGYLLVVFKQLLVYRSKYFDITTDQLQLSGKFLLVEICNGATTGGGFKLSPNSKINDGLFDLVVIKPLNILKRFINLPLLEKGNHISKPFTIYHQNKQIHIKCHQKMPYQIDGELYYDSEFDIKVLRHHFNFK